MPNHITNVLRINAYQHKGVPATLIDEVLEAVKGPDAAFDFNRIIPMPPELQITSGSVSDNALALHDDAKAAEILTYPWGKEFKTIEALRTYLREDYTPTDGIATLDDYAARIRSNIDRHGHDTWYGWSCEKWGTKWNAYSAIAGKVGDNEALIHFESAWSPPIPVLDALAARFPALSMRLIWCDEGADTQHRVWWTEGKRESNEE